MLCWLVLVPNAGNYAKLRQPSDDFGEAWGIGAEEEGLEMQEGHFL
jgi:hypothetical protein